MKWHYNIIKQGKNYYVGEVVGKDSWVLYEDLVADTPQEVIEDLTNKLLDCSHYPILEVKNNKINEFKRTRKKSTN